MSQPVSEEKEKAAAFSQNTNRLERIADGLADELFVTIDGTEEIRRYSRETVRRLILASLSPSPQPQVSKAEPSADERRVNHLQELIRRCPHAQITFCDDPDCEEGAVGFMIRVGGCKTSEACGPTLRDAIDKDIAENGTVEIPPSAETQPIVDLPPVKDERQPTGRELAESCAAMIRNHISATQGGYKTRFSSIAEIIEHEVADKLNERIQVLTVCRDHWKTSFEHDRASTTKMYLCEASRLQLKPNQSYRFKVDPACRLCLDAARLIDPLTSSDATTPTATSVPPLGDPSAPQQFTPSKSPLADSIAARLKENREKHRPSSLPAPPPLPVDEEHKEGEWTAHFVRHGLWVKSFDTPETDSPDSQWNAFFESVAVEHNASLSYLRQQVLNWTETAAQYARDVDFYRGLVRQIGESFGVEAKTSDDGSIQEDVLALKVPELVSSLRQCLHKVEEERDQLRALTGGTPRTPGLQPEETGFVIRGWNEFYDGWLAWLLCQPVDGSKSAAWKDGWNMAYETGPAALTVLQAEIDLKHIVVRAQGVQGSGILASQAPSCSEAESQTVGARGLPKEERSE